MRAGVGHPDEASNASGWKDLGQRGASHAVSGSELLRLMRMLEALGERIEQGALRDLKTGTGFACAKLSEILPTARVARFVRMTGVSRCSLRQDDREARGARFVRMTGRLAVLALVRL